MIYSKSPNTCDLKPLLFVFVPFTPVYFTTTLYLYLIVPIPGWILLCIMVVLSEDNSNVEPTNKPIS